MHACLMPGPATQCRHPLPGSRVAKLQRLVIHSRWAPAPRAGWETAAMGGTTAAQEHTWRVQKPAAQHHSCACLAPAQPTDHRHLMLPMLPLKWATQTQSNPIQSNQIQSSSSRVIAKGALGGQNAARLAVHARPVEHAVSAAAVAQHSAVVHAALSRGRGRHAEVGVLAGQGAAVAQHGAVVHAALCSGKQEAQRSAVSSAQVSRHNSGKRHILFNQ